jgi:hypothetical protein
MEVEIRRRIDSGGRLGLDYSARFVPAAYVRGNPKRAGTWNGSAWTIPAATKRSSVVGVGIKPLGARLWLGAARSRLETDLAVGVFAFSEPLLAANASRINFVLEVGIGVRISRIVVGYRRHHISNGGFAEVNPGLNSDVVFVGFDF